MPFSLLERRQPASQPFTLTPEAEQSLLSQIGSASLGGISAAGNLLDLPGSMVRDLLAVQNPLDQLLTPFSDANRTTGRDLLRKTGLIGKKDTWGNFAGGMALETLLDPTSYLSFGSSALTKGAGQVAKRAGILDDVGRNIAKQAGRTVGKAEARLTGTLADAIGYTTNAAGSRLYRADALENAGKAAQKMGVSLDDLLDQPLGGSVGIGLPFMDPLKVVGTGERALKLARTTDKIGQAVRYGSYSPIRPLASLFDKKSGGAMTESGQKIAAEWDREARDLHVKMRKDLFPLVKELGVNNLLDPDFEVRANKLSPWEAERTVNRRSNALLDYLEAADEIEFPRWDSPDPTSGYRGDIKRKAALPDELKPLAPHLEEIRYRMKELPALEYWSGLRTTDLSESDKVIGAYFPALRQDLSKPVFSGKGGQAIDTSNPFQDYRREDIFKNLQGGRAVLQEMSTDRDISGVLHRKDPATGIRKMLNPDSQEYGDVISHVMGIVRKKYGDKLRPIPDDPSRVGDAIEMADLFAGDAPEAPKVTPHLEAFRRDLRTVGNLDDKEATAIEGVWRAWSKGYRQKPLEDTLRETLEGVRRSTPDELPPDALFQSNPQWRSKVIELASDPQKVGKTVTKDKFLSVLKRFGVGDEEIADLDIESIFQYGPMDKADVLELLNDRLPRVEEVWQDEARGNVQYAENTVPGGDPGTYKELLLTLPDNHHAPPGMPDRGSFKQSHWNDTPDVVAHVRMDDVTLPSGEKRLRIHEIQSDWHQKGAKKGYQRPLPEPENFAAWARRKGVMPDEADRLFRDKTSLLFQEWKASHDEWLENTKRLPDAPFKQSWQKLALRRAIKHAVENGYSEIEVVPGTSIAAVVDGPRTGLTAWHKTLGEMLQKLTKPYGGAVEQLDRTTKAATEQYVGQSRTIDDVTEALRQQQHALATGDDATRVRAHGHVIALESLLKKMKAGEAFEDAIVNLGSNRHRALKVLGGEIGKAESEAAAKVLQYAGPEFSADQLRQAADKILSASPHLSDDGLEIGNDVLAARALRYAEEMGKTGKKFSALLNDNLFAFRSDADMDMLHRGVAKAVGGGVEEVLDPAKGYRLPITDKMREAFSQAQPLYQDGKGAVTFGKDGRAMLHAFDAADVSTHVHEFAHIARRNLTTEDQQIAAEFVGAAVGQDWTRAQEETFARGFEKYLRDGTAPSSRIRQVFDALKQAMTAIYKSIVGSPIDVNLTPEITDLYNRLIRGSSTPDAKLAQRANQGKDAARIAQEAFNAGMSVPPPLKTTGAPEIGDAKLRQIAQWMADLDPQHAELGVPAFHRNPLQPLMARMDSHLRAVQAAGMVQDLFAQHAQHLSKDAVGSVEGTKGVNPQWVPLRDALSKQGVDLTDVAFDSIKRKMQGRQITRQGPQGLEDWAAPQYDRIPKDVPAENTDIYVPAEIVQEATRYLGTFKSPEAVSWLVDKMDSFMRVFKTWVTGWPAFHVRNKYSGEFNNFLGGAYDKGYPLSAVKSLMAGEEIKGAGQKFLGDAKLSDKAASERLRQLAFAHGVIGSHHGQAGETLGEASRRVATQIPGMANFQSLRHPPEGTTWADALLPLKKEGSNLWTRTHQDVGYLVEASNRLAPFLGFLQQGWSPQAAAQKVLAMQVDYQGLSKFEGNVMRRLAPFYSYTRGMMPYTLEQLLEKPGGRLAGVVKATAKGHESGVLTPDYVASGASIPLGEREDGSQRYLTGFGLMHEDPLSMVAGPRQLGLELLSRSNPLLKGPLEYVTGASFFQTTDRGGRQLDSLDPPVGRTIANLTGLEDPHVLPTLAEQAIANSPLTRAVNVARTASDSRKGAGGKALNLLTGARITDVSPAAQDALVRERSYEIMRDLGAQEFSRVRFRKEDIAAMSPEEAEEALRFNALMNHLANKAKQRAKAKEQVK